MVFVHDNFGQCGQSMNTDGGWLTTQLEVRLSFLKNPIRWWKKRHQTLKYCMKVMATDPNVNLEWFSIYTQPYREKGMDRRERDKE